MELKKLIEERANAWERMKALNDAAEKRDSGALEGGEVEEYTKLEARVDEIGTELERRTRFDTRAKGFEGGPGAGAGAANPGKDDAEPVDARQARELAEFRSFLRGGPAPTEARALQADSDTEGGYLLAPQTVAVGLIKAVDNLTFVRQYAHKETLLTSESLGVVTMDTDFGAADWTQELTTPTVDEGLRIGKRELKPIPLTKETKLSRTLVRRTAGGAETLVMNRLAYQFSVTGENASLNGSGAGQPLGTFTASAQGISTARDVSTGNTSTSIQADGLIEVKHTLKGQYWSKARWTFHRDAVKQIRKLKDGDGQYLWSPGLAGGMPNTILDSPYDMSEYCPNTFTSGLYVGLLCDWEYYWIVDALQLEIQVLNELYARSNQFGYIGRMESDGMPVLEEAFVRVKLG